MPSQSPVDPKKPHRFAKWLRRLKGKHGVYAFYSRCETCNELTREECSRRGCPGSGPVCQYVGVSSRARLSGTIERHLQQWSPRRDGTIPGWTFDRHEVSIDHQVYEDPRMALAAEQVWIAERAPLLNKQCVIPALEPENDLADEYDAEPPSNPDLSFDVFELEAA